VIVAFFLDSFGCLTFKAASPLNAVAAAAVRVMRSPGLWISTEDLTVEATQV
jgi:hypothetical protein